jgi:hypothetical protein
MIRQPGTRVPRNGRPMQLAGVVRIEVPIGSGGKIKESKVIGVHPVLVHAAMRAQRLFVPQDFLLHSSLEKLC